jgi:hypothetical protein
MTLKTVSPFEERTMNTGFYAARLVNLNAELQRLVAKSEDHKQIYFIATEMMLELAHLRDLAKEGKIQQ